MTSYAKLISLQPSAAKETSYVEMGSERRWAEQINDRDGAYNGLPLEVHWYNNQGAEHLPLFWLWLFVI